MPYYRIEVREVLLHDFFTFAASPEAAEAEWEAMAEPKPAKTTCVDYGCVSVEEEPECPVIS